MTHVDQVLAALCATGPDAYRADADRPGTWHAYCPACPPTETRRLTVTERRDGTVDLRCSLRCTRRSILVALRLAELAYEAGTALGWWPEGQPSGVAPVAEQALARRHEQQRVVRALWHERHAA